MTKTSFFARTDRFDHVPSRYRRLCAEMFCETKSSGRFLKETSSSDIPSYLAVLTFPENMLLIGISDSDDESEFQIHRKMLRRRHVRKEQKERARRRQQLEEKEEMSRQNNAKDSSLENTTDSSNQDSWKPDTQETGSTKNPVMPNSFAPVLPSTPPPQTVASPMLSSPAKFQGAIAPTFSPIRSRKLRSRLF